MLVWWYAAMLLQGAQRQGACRHADQHTVSTANVGQWVCADQHSPIIMGRVYTAAAVQDSAVISGIWIPGMQPGTARSHLHCAIAPNAMCVQQAKLVKQRNN